MDSLELMQVVSDFRHFVNKDYYCKKCKYYYECEDEDECAGFKALHKTLTLLEKMLPRVMSREETYNWLSTIKMARWPVWFEVKDGIVICVASEIVFTNDDWESVKDGYGKTWRCWAGSKPSEEMRQETEWE